MPAQNPSKPPRTCADSRNTPLARRTPARVSGPNQSLARNTSPPLRIVRRASPTRPDTRSPSPTPTCSSHESHPSPWLASPRPVSSASMSIARSPSISIRARRTPRTSASSSRPPQTSRSLANARRTTTQPHRSTSTSTSSHPAHTATANRHPRTRVSRTPRVGARRHRPRLGVARRQERLFPPRRYPHPRRRSRRRPNPRPTDARVDLIPSATSPRSSSPRIVVGRGRGGAVLCRRSPVVIHFSKVCSICKP